MQKIKWYGFAGICLSGISWACNWYLAGLRTHIFFFPQWLGFILFLDALIYSRKKTSLINRSVIKFILLFFLSIPVWWLFELFNRINQNWIYEGREYFNDLEYFILASICFSTVMPVVFEMTELIASFNWTQKIRWGPKIKSSDLTAVILLSIGILMIVLDLFRPQYFYFFIWLSPFFIVEAFNILLKNKSVLHFTEYYNWRPLYMLAIGCCLCGFFWEFWNYYSFPKWRYQIPFLGFFKVFEMPILGYLGYIPFSFELYSVYIFINRTKRGDENYIIID